MGAGCGVAERDGDVGAATLFFAGFGIGGEATGEWSSAKLTGVKSGKKKRVPRGTEKRTCMEMYFAR